jgi:RNA polymerase sigma-70 factor (ECF subfamily)
MMTKVLTKTQAFTISKQTLVSIYEEHSPGIYRYAYRLLGDRDTAEECVAETFSRFLQAIQAGRGPRENVKAYLYRSAHNWIVDSYRQKPASTLELNEELLSSGHEGNPSDEVSRKLLQDRLRKALSTLPYDQQRVVEMRFIDEMSHSEVAEELAKTEEATRALQHRAITSLRRLLLSTEEKPND